MPLVIRPLASDWSEVRLDFRPSDSVALQLDLRLAVGERRDRLALDRHQPADDRLHVDARCGETDAVRHGCPFAGDRSEIGCSCRGDRPADGKGARPCGRTPLRRRTSQLTSSDQRRSDRIVCGIWFAWASIAVPACCRTWFLVNATISGRHVGVTDAGLRSREVLGGDLQVVDHRLEAVLERTEVATGGRDGRDRRVERRDRRGGAGAGRDVQRGDARQDAGAC